MKLYKLTDVHGRTSNQTQWGEGVTHTAPGKGPMCSPGWLHAYTDPLLAVFLNPIHGNFKHPILWEAEGDVGIEDCGLKVGCTKLTTVKQMPLPEVTREHRVAFGILCAMEVCEDTEWRDWAQKWLSGEDRSERAAAAYVAYDTYAASDTYAAYAASASATYAAAYDTAAYDAAYDAAYAAECVARTKPIDLIQLAKKAYDNETSMV